MEETDRGAEEIEDYSAVVGMGGALAEQKAMALISRGRAHGKAGRVPVAIEDYSAVIRMADAPAEEKARALINRGLIYWKAGRAAEEIEDYSAVIRMEDAPAEQKAIALIKRGLTYGKEGRATEEIEDYSAVIDMEGAPVEQKAAALINRGIAYSEAGRSAEEIKDYSAVIGMADAPAQEKVRALVGRSWTRFENVGDVKALLDDSRTALELVPGDDTARMNLALALLLTGEADAAMAEYERLVSGNPGEAVIGDAVRDLQAETAKRPDLPGAERALALLENAIGTVQPGATG